jgi:predicted metal-binding membrane protein
MRATAGFPPLALALIALAWACIVLWDASPYGRYLEHGNWISVGLPAAICAIVPAGDWIVPGTLYASGWVVMTAAMMLPSILPLARLFDRMIATRAERSTLHLLLIVGYLLAWAGFGIAAHLLDYGVHALLARWTWLSMRAWLLGSLVLAAAGAFQFSSTKYHCLDRCRTPLGFLMRYWTGSQPRREALQLGIAHGAFCVGCCWALMLLMFVVGTGSLAWMLLLGLIMALEKNHRWGRQIARPLGLGLLLSAATVAASGLV